MPRCRRFIWRARAAFAPTKNGIIISCGPSNASAVWTTKKTRFVPAIFCLDLEANAPQIFVASTETVDLAEANNSYQSVVEAKRALAQTDDFEAPGARLKLAADQFIVKRADGLSTGFSGLSLVH